MGSLPTSSCIFQCICCIELVQKGLLRLSSVILARVMEEFLFHKQPISKSLMKQIKFTGNCLASLLMGNVASCWWRHFLFAFDFIRFSGPYYRNCCNFIRPLAGEKLPESHGPAGQESTGNMDHSQCVMNWTIDMSVPGCKACRGIPLKRPECLMRKMSTGYNAACV